MAAIGDKANQSATDFVSVSDDVLSHAITEHALDFCYVAVGQFWLGASVEPKPLNMLSVIRGACPFEVGGEVVRLQAVEVVDLRQVVRVRNKSFGDESVDEMTADLSADAESDVGIFLGAQLIPSHSLTNDHSLSPAHDAELVHDLAIKTPHSSMTADFVEPSEGLRERSPFFNSVHRVHPFESMDGIYSEFSRIQ